jgi:hypothetical protein
MPTREDLGVSLTAPDEYINNRGALVIVVRHGLFMGGRAGLYSWGALVIVVRHGLFMGGRAGLYSWGALVIVVRHGLFMGGRAGLYSCRCQGWTLPVPSDLYF